MKRQELDQVRQKDVQDLRNDIASLQRAMVELRVGQQEGHVRRFKLARRQLAQMLTVHRQKDVSHG